MCILYIFHVFRFSLLRQTRPEDYLLVPIILCFSFYIHSVFNVFFSLSVKLNDNTVLLFIFMSILFT